MPGSARVAEASQHVGVRSVREQPPHRGGGHPGEVDERHDDRLDLVRERGEPRAERRRHPLRPVVGDDDGVEGEQRLMAGLVGALVLCVTGGALIDTFGAAELSRAEPSLTADVSDMIFSQYIVPFEAVSVLLLAALIGAVVVARKD